MRDKGFPRPSFYRSGTRMLTSKLKLVDNGDAGGVFSQAGFAIADEVANATEAWRVIKSISPRSTYWYCALTLQ
jgi:hypothetical protein